MGNSTLTILQWLAEEARCGFGIDERVAFTAEWVTDNDVYYEGAYQDWDREFLSWQWAKKASTPGPEPEKPLIAFIVSAPQHYGIFFATDEQHAAQLSMDTWGVNYNGLAIGVWPATLHDLGTYFYCQGDKC